MKKTISILICGFLLLALAQSVSSLESKESSRIKSGKTIVKGSEGSKDKSVAPSTATKRQTADKVVALDPVSASSGIMVTGETISWEVMAGGGQFGTSTNFGLSGTIGEGAVGDGFSTNFGVLGGFEQNFSAGSTICCEIAGDASDDGKTNIADVAFVISWLFAGGDSPECCSQASANGDDKVNIADVSFVITWLFGGGADPICGPVDLSC